VEPVRALLVYNPNATTTNPAVTDVITRALSAQLKLEVQATKRRNHAGYLAAGAVHDGVDVVIALGGDGTMNEVLQGVANTPARLAVIPGGSTNVLARTLGLPNDAVEATSVILRKLRDGEERTVSLGSANGRYFAVNAGYGYDAEVVRFVERRHRLKRTVRQASFLWSGMLAYVNGFDRKAEIVLRLDEGELSVPLRSAVCCNANPYTYLLKWPAQLCPRADIEGGLDLLGLTRLSLFSLIRLVRAALSSTDVGALRATRLWHDRTRYELASPVPLPLQLDGDFVEETDRVLLRSVPNALTVIA
jgi:diacylglycerol kinase family enzyme